MTDQSLKFQSTFRRLNPAQKQAVEAIEGPVMVVAGPGTGKTHVLTTRIANIIHKTDTAPHNILALTFTESAATNMRRRLVDLIGTTGYYVRIETFHAFCSQVIQEHPEYFSIQRGSSPLTNLERFALFEDILSALDLEVIKPLNQPFFYLKECMIGISNLKREGHLPVDFAELLEQEAAELEVEAEELTKTELKKRQRNLAKQQELLEVYKAYQAELRVRLRYDFDDMIMLVKEAFEQEELLLREYQEEIHYFLVDEYQDTNAAQNRVVDLLASYWQQDQQPNLFVVGDPHQSIYRFQGASMENMLSFIDRYPKALVVTLEQGYRCTQLVYQAAHTLIGHNSLTQVNETLSPALNRLLLSPKENGAKLQVYEAPSQVLELQVVVERIKRLLSEGVPAAEIAVLYRNNADVIELQQTLDHLGIAYEIDGGGNVLDSEHIRQLIVLLQVVSELRSGGSADKLFEVLCYEWTAPNASLALRLARSAGKAKLSILDLLLTGYDTFAQHHVGPAVSESDFEVAQEFVEQLCTWGVLDAQLTFPEWFELVIDQSGFLDWILQLEAKVEKMVELNALYREIKSLAQSRQELQLQDFLDALAVMYEHNIWLEAEDLHAQTDAIQLATVHKAKGQEWSHVFLLHCTDRKWGNVRNRELLPLPEGLLKHTQLEKKERNEDERRLFYVALTRASQEVFISYPKTIISAAQSKDVVGSMFISEVSEFTEEYRGPEITELQQDPSALLSTLFRPESNITIGKSDEDYFKALVKHFPLSVTALNTYLKDPSEFVLNSLLRVPRAKPEHMAFGTAIHNALEHVYKHIQRCGELPALATVFKHYQRSLEQELLVSVDFNRRLEYGKQVLETYVSQIDTTTVQPLFMERFFGGGGSRTMLGDIALTGRIDRVDWIDKASKTVRVIDYKTGKSKSDNEIKGLTKSAPLSEREQSLPETIRGPYQRQLVFYKLLTELDVSFIPTVSEVMFDFVEPNKQTGKLVTRSFTVSGEAVADLKQLITTVMQEIRSLSFLAELEQS